MSIIILSYLLAIVQLTRQVDNVWFSPVFYDFLIEFINIRPVYIRGWVGGARGWGGWWQKLNQRKKECTNSRVWSSYDMYMHPQRANISLQGLDRRALTVGAISGCHSQLGALLWRHFTSRGFTWSAKSIQGKQTSPH